MTRRERLMATLAGKTVDRPAVSFYELNGIDEDPANTDPFNIFSHPSWLPLIELTCEKSDIIAQRGVSCETTDGEAINEATKTTTEIRGGSRFTRREITVGGRVLTSRTRRDPGVNTTWTEEHLLKDADDIRAFLQIPQPMPTGVVHTKPFTDTEERLGDAGIVMIDTADPLCLAAGLFSMADYTVFAMTEPNLFHQLIEHFAERLMVRTMAVSRALPGRLWRIYGPEYAAPPFLPPELFREYVCRHDKPMVEAIQANGGYARIHSPGNLRAVLDDISSMGADGLDPVEPPPQGDVELKYVRENYGAGMVLFGNLEVSDIENMPTPQFAEKVKRALDEGTSGNGRGFVLMPSACPYGRVLSPLTMRNYEKLIELAHG